MSVKDSAEQSLSKLFINIVVVIVFTALMAVVIVMMLRAEPGVNKTAMEGFARQFQQSSETAHWQWQAQGRPERIMLIHYNAQKQERARTPVRMEHTGRPWIEPTSAGCEKLWINLLYEPTQADGFKVIAEYFAKQDNENTEELGFCRYRLSRGPYFDYDLVTGAVSFSNTN